MHLVFMDKEDDRTVKHEYLHDAAILIGMIVSTKPYYPEVDKPTQGPTIDGEHLMISMLKASFRRKNVSNIT